MPRKRRWWISLVCVMVSTIIMKNYGVQVPLDDLVNRVIDL